MRSFKEAEQYGKLAVDSLTVAQAEYWMGKMLYEDYMEDEALSILKKSDAHFGLRNTERAYVNNLEAIVYIVLKQFDEAEMSLEKSLDYAELGLANKIKIKVLNNYAVLRHLEGKNDEAIAKLKKADEVFNLNDSEKTMLFLNFVKSFLAQDEFDSAAVYVHHLEELLPTDQVKDETKASSYETLSRMAEIQGDTASAFQYLKKRQNIVSAILANIEKKSVYRIQQQYDYESLQNKMIQERSRMQRLVAIGIVLLLCIVALFFYQSSQRNKKEAETNANLFHFMQQNRALVESNIEHEKKAIDTMQQLSDVLFARLKAMQKLDYSLKNPKDKIALKDLEKEVFGDGEHWEAVKEVLDALYPGLWESLKLKYPEMDEMERRVFMMSRLKLSRLGEATLLGISTSVLDKLRTKVHRIVEEEKI